MAGMSYDPLMVPGGTISPCCKSLAIPSPQPDEKRPTYICGDCYRLFNLVTPIETEAAVSRLITPEVGGTQDAAVPKYFRPAPGVWPQ